MALRPKSKKSKAEQEAERKAAQDDVLMREIDEAVRQDQMAQFAQTYGKPLLALLVLGILAFGAYLFWDARQEAQMEQQSERLIAALDQAQAGNTASANEQAAALAEEGEGAARASALMVQAGVALQEQRDDDAAALFMQVADDADAPPALRDLALIRHYSLTFDQADPAEVVERLAPLAVPGNPWFGSAGELVAIAQIERGNTDEAGTLLAEIAKSDDVPETLRTRARQLAGLLGFDAIDNVEELLEAQTQPLPVGTGGGAPGAR